eukprot:gene20178-24195_t
MKLRLPARAGAAADGEGRSGLVLSDMHAFGAHPAPPCGRRGSVVGVASGRASLLLAPRRDS